MADVGLLQFPAMTKAKSNVVLIGMPGAGKSTLGVILARRLGLNFVDTDLLIQHREGQTLQEIVDQRGHQQLRAIEAQVLSTLKLQGYVIATGGSAVYSQTAMDALSADGLIVHLHVDLPIILTRVTDFDTRGIAREAGQTLEALYAEREALYRRYAQISVDVGTPDHERAADAVINALKQSDTQRLASGIMPNS